MWAAALGSWSIEKLHLKIIAGRAVQGAEHKSNGFFLQMCEDEAQGTDVLSSGGGQHILANKKRHLQGGQRCRGRAPRPVRMLPSQGREEGRGREGELSAAQTSGCLVNSTV